MKVYRLLVKAPTAIAAVCSLIPLTLASGQQVEPTGFDIDRAFILDSTIFEPFHVTSTRPLREVLEERIIADDTPLLVLERSGGALALVTEQMAYHHIAQGVLAGEPWMVSF